MRRKHFFFIGWLVLVLVASFACQTPTAPQEPDSQVPTPKIPAPVVAPATEPTLPPQAPKWQLEAHYFLNNKYYQDVPKEKLEAWRTELLRAKLSDTDAAYDLLSHKGGGPKGAEWNSDADILLVLTGRDLEPGIPISVNMKLNEGSYQAKTVVKENGNLTFFSMAIPADVWLPRLRKIRQSDYLLLYDMQAIESASNDPGSPVGIGEILVVELLITTDKGQAIKAHYKRAFHHASGE